MNKRNIIIVIIFAVFSLITVNNATAQLNAVEISKPEELMTINMAYSWLYKTSIGYEIWATTDNQFDEGFNAIRLGTTKDECIQSLNDLLDMCVNQKSAVVKQGYDELMIRANTIFGGKTLIFQESDNAGDSWISERQIKKVIKWFENIAE